MGRQLELAGIVKEYGTAVKTTVLRGIDLSFERGEFTSIIGQSGSGKSTLLNMIGVLDRPTRGTTRFEGRDLYSMRDDELAAFRNTNIGFIFQFHYLLPEFTALENVLIPFMIAGGRVPESARKRARDLVARVGVGDRMNNKSTNLSGGQQQRIAIARALMNGPQMVLADEPTGNLDSDTSDGIFKLLRQINREEKTTFIIVSHDRHIAAASDRVIEIADGRIVSDIRPADRPDEESWDRLAPCYCRLRRSADKRE